MLSIDYSFLFFLTVYTGAVTLVGSLALRSYQERIFLACGILTVYLYSGVGASLPDVPGVYSLYYGVFITLLVMSFVVGARAVPPRLEFNGIQRFVESHPKLLKRIAIIYIAFCLVPLMYPEFKLLRLINPPLPDIRTYFYSIVEQRSGGAVLALHSQIKMLFFPVFLIALSSFKHKRIAIPLGLSILLYIQYCTNAYIGRYEILQYTFACLLSLYLQRQITPRFLFLFGGVFMVGFIVFYGYYTQIRLGVLSSPGQSVSFGEAFADFVSSEFNYPEHFATILEGGRQVDLWRYFTWIITLPIPKALIGTGVSLRLNYDIAEYLFGASVGQGGAYVVLVSVVGESVFIFGRYFFWVHAVLLGLFFGFICGLFRKTPGLQSNFAYLASVLLLLGRGGVSSVIPPIVNGFLLIYMWMIMGGRGRQGGTESLPHG